MGLDEVVNGSQESTVEAPAVQQEQVSAEQPEHGAPTAPAEHHVPLAALEAERAQRNDWKTKAVQFETELKLLREQQAQPRTERPALDPLQSMQQQIINERFNYSEMLLRQQHEDADEKVNLFMEAARANPALSAALQQQRHPWKFAYDEGARMLAAKEIGPDPAAYREKVRAELLAEMNGTVAAPAAPALKLPASLNGARSVAPRSAPSFTGPTPLDAIVNHRRTQ